MKFNTTKIFLALFFSSAVMASGGDDSGNGGINYLVRSPVNQYTCLTLGGKVSSNGDVTIDGVARTFHNYMDEVMPEAIEQDTRFYRCHDVALYGYEDSIEYPRLELIRKNFSLFSRFDARFMTDSSNKREIDKLIEDRLQREYQIPFASNLFFQFPVGPEGSYGFMLRPIRDVRTNTVFCPSSEYFAVSPLIQIITDFTGETEGLYYGVMEKQSFPQGTGVIANLYIPESKILKYGFYFRDGEKIKIELDSLIEKETAYVYYPFSDRQDPLVKGNRKIVTIKFPGNNPSGNTKKLGCIFKSEK